MSNRKPVNLKVRQPQNTIRSSETSASRADASAHALNRQTQERLGRHSTGQQPQKTQNDLLGYDPHARIRSADTHAQYKEPVNAYSDQYRKTQYPERIAPKDYTSQQGYRQYMPTPRENPMAYSRRSADDVRQQSFHGQTARTPIQSEHRAGATRVRTEQPVTPSTTSSRWYGTEQMQNTSGRIRFAGYSEQEWQNIQNKQQQLFEKKNPLKNIGSDSVRRGTAPSQSNGSPRTLRVHQSQEPAWRDYGGRGLSVQRDYSTGLRQSDPASGLQNTSTRPLRTVEQVRAAINQTRTNQQIYSAGQERRPQGNPIKQQVRQIYNAADYGASIAERKVWQTVSERKETIKSSKENLIDPKIRQGHDGLKIKNSSDTLSKSIKSQMNKCDDLRTGLTNRGINVSKMSPKEIRETLDNKRYMSRHLSIKEQRMLGQYLEKREALSPMVSELAKNTRRANQAASRLRTNADKTKKAYEKYHQELTQRVASGGSPLSASEQTKLQRLRTSSEVASQRARSATEKAIVQRQRLKRVEARIGTREDQTLRMRPSRYNAVQNRQRMLAKKIQAQTGFNPSTASARKIRAQIAKTKKELAKASPMRVPQLNKRVASLEEYKTSLKVMRKAQAKNLLRMRKAANASMQAAGIVRRVSRMADTEDSEALPLEGRHIPGFKPYSAESWAKHRKQVVDKRAVRKDARELRKKEKLKAKADKKNTDPLKDGRLKKAKAKKDAKASGNLRTDSIREKLAKRRLEAKNKKTLKTGSKSRLSKIRKRGTGGLNGASGIAGASRGLRTVQGGGRMATFAKGFLKTLGRAIVTPRKIIMYVVLFVIAAILASDILSAMLGQYAHALSNNPTIAYHNLFGMDLEGEGEWGTGQTWEELLQCVKDQEYNTPYSGVDAMSEARPENAARYNENNKTIAQYLVDYMYNYVKTQKIPSFSQKVRGAYPLYQIENVTLDGVRIPNSMIEYSTEEWQNLSRKYTSENRQNITLEPSQFTARYVYVSNEPAQQTMPEWFSQMMQGSSGYSEQQVWEMCELILTYWSRELTRTLGGQTSKVINATFSNSSVLALKQSQESDWIFQIDFHSSGKHGTAGTQFTRAYTKLALFDKYMKSNVNTELVKSSLTLADSWLFGNGIKIGGVINAAADEGYYLAGWSLEPNSTRPDFVLNQTMDLVDVLKITDKINPDTGHVDLYAVYLPNDRRAQLVEIGVPESTQLEEYKAYTNTDDLSVAYAFTDSFLDEQITNDEEGDGFSYNINSLFKAILCMVTCAIENTELIGDGGLMVHGYDIEHTLSTNNNNEINTTSTGQVTYNMVITNLEQYCTALIDLALDDKNNHIYIDYETKRLVGSHDNSGAINDFIVRRNPDVFSQGQAGTGDAAYLKCRIVIRSDTSLDRLMDLDEYGSEGIYQKYEEATDTQKALVAIADIVTSSFNNWDSWKNKYKENESLAGDWAAEIINNWWYQAVGKVTEKGSWIPDNYYLISSGITFQDGYYESEEEGVYDAAKHYAEVVTDKTNNRTPYTTYQAKLETDENAKLKTILPKDVMADSVVVTDLKRVEVGMFLFVSQAPAASYTLGKWKNGHIGMYIGDGKVLDLSSYALNANVEDYETYQEVGTAAGNENAAINYEDYLINDNLRAHLSTQDVSNYQAYDGSYYIYPIYQLGDPSSLTTESYVATYNPESQLVTENMNSQTDLNQSGATGGEMYDSFNLSAENITADGRVVIGDVTYFIPGIYIERQIQGGENSQPQASQDAVAQMNSLVGQVCDLETWIQVYTQLNEDESGKPLSRGYVTCGYYKPIKQIIDDEKRVVENRKQKQQEEETRQYMEDQGIVTWDSAETVTNHVTRVAGENDLAYDFAIDDDTYNINLIPFNNEYASSGDSEAVSNWPSIEAYEPEVKAAYDQAFGNGAYDRAYKETAKSSQFEYAQFVTTLRHKVRNHLLQRDTPVESSYKGSTTSLYYKYISNCNLFYIDETGNSKHQSSSFLPLLFGENDRQVYLFAGWSRDTELGQENRDYVQEYLRYTDQEFCELFNIVFPNKYEYTHMEGESNYAKIYNYLVEEEHFSSAAALAVLGNLRAECGLTEEDLAEMQSKEAERMATLQRVYDGTNAKIREEAERINASLERISSTKLDSAASGQTSGYLANIPNGYFEFPLKGEYSLTGTTGATDQEIDSGEKGVPSSYQGRFIQDHWEFHDGVDIWAPEGTPIYAAASGTIEELHPDGSGGDCDGLYFGNHIMIRHDIGYSTIYGHMSRFAPDIYEGAYVEKGQLIGYVGHTGLCVGPDYGNNQEGNHLHFAITSTRHGKGYWVQTLSQYNLTPEQYIQTSEASGANPVLATHYGCTNPWYYFGKEGVEWANNYYNGNTEALNGDPYLTQEEVWTQTNPDNFMSESASGSSTRRVSANTIKTTYVAKEDEAMLYEIPDDYVGVMPGHEDTGAVADKTYGLAKTSWEDFSNYVLEETGDTITPEQYESGEVKVDILIQLRQYLNKLANNFENNVRQMNNTTLMEYRALNEDLVGVLPANWFMLIQMGVEQWDLYHAYNAYYRNDDNDDSRLDYTQWVQEEEEDTENTSDTTETEGFEEDEPSHVLNLKDTTSVSLNRGTYLLPTYEGFKELSDIERATRALYVSFYTRYVPESSDGEPITGLQSEYDEYDALLRENTNNTVKASEIKTSDPTLAQYIELIGNDAYSGELDDGSSYATVDGQPYDGTNRAEVNTVSEQDSARLQEAYDAIFGANAYESQLTTYGNVSDVDMIHFMSERKDEIAHYVRMSTIYESELRFLQEHVQDPDVGIERRVYYAIEWYKTQVVETRQIKQTIVSGCGAAAVEWAKEIADNDEYGYGYAGVTETGPVYDCSSLVSSAYTFGAGHELNFGANCQMDYIFATLEAAGFEQYNMSDMMDQLITGDILLTGDGGHTEMYFEGENGETMTVGAHNDFGGGTSDVDGTEIDYKEVDLNNGPHDGWQYVFRCTQHADAPNPSSASANNVHIGGVLSNIGATIGQPNNKAADPIEESVNAPTYGTRGRRVRASDKVVNAAKREYVIDDPGANDADVAWVRLVLASAGRRLSDLKVLQAKERAGYGYTMKPFVTIYPGIPLDDVEDGKIFASDFYAYMCKYTYDEDINKIKPGMIIASCGTPDEPYGHIGIILDKSCVKTYDVKDRIFKYLTPDEFYLEYQSGYDTVHFGFAPGTNSFEPGEPIWDKESFEEALEETEDCTVEEIAEVLDDLYGYDEEIAAIIITTTFREGYFKDPFMFYGWFCVMNNLFQDGMSAQQCYNQMRGWEAPGGTFYSRDTIWGTYTSGTIDSWEGDEGVDMRKAMMIAALCHNDAICSVQGVEVYGEIMYQSDYYTAERIGGNIPATICATHLE